MNLAKNFTLEEFTRSQRAEKLGISNVPNTKELINLQLLADFMQIVRDRLCIEIDISSGFRCEKLNNSTPGSSKTSAHRLGLACDSNCHTMPTATYFNLIISLVNQNILQDFDQIIYEKNSSGSEWVHIGIGGKKRKEILMGFVDKEGNAGYRNYK